MKTNYGMGRRPYQHTHYSVISSLREGIAPSVSDEIVVGARAALPVLLLLSDIEAGRHHALEAVQPRVAVDVYCGSEIGFSRVGCCQVLTYIRLKKIQMKIGYQVGKNPKRNSILQDTRFQEAM